MLYDEKLPLNDWGTFTGEFSLASEPPLGDYSIEVVLPKYRQYASFSVEAYRKPEFSVTATIPQRHYLGTTTIPVHITASYFFGSPVSRGKVHYNINFAPTQEAPPSAIISAAGLGSSAIAAREEDYEGTGVLDANGVLDRSCI